MIFPGMIFTAGVSRVTAPSFGGAGEASAGTRSLGASWAQRAAPRQSSNTQANKREIASIHKTRVSQIARFTAPPPPDLPGGPRRDFIIAPGFRKASPLRARGNRDWKCRRSLRHVLASLQEGTGKGRKNERSQSDCRDPLALRFDAAAREGAGGTGREAYG